MNAQRKIKSPVGTLYMAATDKGLAYLSWEDSVIKFDSSKKSEKFLEQTEKELKEFFNKKRTRFSISLDMQGTEFQKKVWKSLTKIPFGKTWSYKDLATHVGQPKASRAVGGANGKNPVCIIVPCHRVIAADGTLGGFSGGLNHKKQLLKHETLV